MKELMVLIQVNGRSFEEHTGRVEITLSSSIIARQLFRAMERGRSIQELRLTLAWKTTVNGLKTLWDTVYRSNLFHLDLTCANAPSMSALFGRINPLLELMTTAHTFILSAYRGAFPNTCFSTRITELTRLKIADQVN
ncbi:hypothetical protein BGW39_006566 [Mortierella sp. 14UC]|nr:hypothetical protein BGW39_006566 [Mortierella sp. 14UC]